MGWDISKKIESSFNIVIFVRKMIDFTFVLIPMHFCNILYNTHTTYIERFESIVKTIAKENTIAMHMTELKI